MHASMQFRNPWHFEMLKAYPKSTPGRAPVSWMVTSSPRLRRASSSSRRMVSWRSSSVMKR